MADRPIVCTLGPDALKARRGQDCWLMWRDSRWRLLEISAGYRFEFAARPETLSFIAEMIDAERQCCRFLRFVLTVEQDFGPLRLDVTGPEGTQEFLSALLEST